MEGVLMLTFLSFTMLIGSFISGLVPLALNLSESKMRHITILGAGLLIGTALAVIIPEGIHTLYSNEKCLEQNQELNVKEQHLSHVHKRSVEFDKEQFELFLKQISVDKNLLKRATDKELIELFLNSIAVNNNLLNKVLKRSMSDQELIDLFHKQLGETININQVLTKRSLSEQDRKMLEVFLSHLASDKNLNLHQVNKRQANDAVVAKEQLKIKEDLEKSKQEEHHDHGDSHPHSSNSHSAIGITLVLGFVFMLIVDQIGGKVSHRHHQVLDSQAVRNKITFSTTLGLVVHAAADGIALGAAAATSKTDIEMIVFIAIMLHKAPAAFGLVSFLMHEGLDRSKVRKHLTIFAMAAPVMAIFTFLALSSSSMNVVSSNSTGLCMLFSAGTFLYVSTVHVLPEVQSHNEDRQFRFAEMMSFILGAMMPVFLTIGHSH